MIQLAILLPEEKLQSRLLSLEVLHPTFPVFHPPFHVLECRVRRRVFPLQPLVLLAAQSEQLSFLSLELLHPPFQHGAPTIVDDVLEHAEQRVQCHRFLRTLELVFRMSDGRLHVLERFNDLIESLAVILLPLLL